MIESPLLQQFEAEITAEATAKAKHEDIADVLQSRFGDLPSDLSGRVKLIQDLERLQELIRLAAKCPDLAAFEAALS